MPLTTPSTDDLVIRSMLERNAASWPHELAVMFEDGSTWTNLQALEMAYSAAESLRAAGLRQGGRVAIFMENGPNFLRAWWGASVLGAAIVPVNTSYRGFILEHLLGLSEPILVVGDDLLSRLDELDERFRKLLRLSGAELIGSSAQAPPLDRPIAAWDHAALILTSGTTGPSKLASETNLHIYTADVGMVGGPGDTFQADLPLFHASGIWTITACLKRRTKISLRTRPNLRAYWEVARDTGATAAFLVGTMATFLSEQPPRSAEREHRIKRVQAAPFPSDPPGFMKRFGVQELYGAYGSSELPKPITSDPRDEIVSNYLGRVRAGFECRLVDEWDNEIPDGDAGELIVRADYPWMISTEYVGNPGATAAVWRNGWFHTGDLMRRDGEGRYYWVDRRKDALRRRGENISSSEVEREVMTHADVIEAACVSYREPGAVEDEVKVWLVAKAGIDLTELVEHCARRMPHFMVPSYFEIVDELPKTPSAKVKKVELRERGNGGATWDRAKAGLQVTRNGVKRV